MASLKPVQDVSEVKVSKDEVSSRRSSFVEKSLSARLTLDCKEESLANISVQKITNQERKRN